MKTIDWNTMSEFGLIKRINTEILHPLGLAISRNPENGVSESILVADDGVWEYSEKIKNQKVMTDEEIKEKLN